MSTISINLILLAVLVLLGFLAYVMAERRPVNDGVRDCPRCGAENDRYCIQSGYDGRGGRLFFVKCHWCRVEGACAYTPEEAVETWNSGEIDRSSGSLDETTWGGVVPNEELRP